VQISQEINLWTQWSINTSQTHGCVQTLETLWNW